MTQDLSAFGVAAEKIAAGNTVTQGQLVEAANEAVDLEAKIEDLDSLLAKMKGRLNTLKTQIIPVGMAQLGQLNFTLLNGFKIEVEDFIAVSDIKDKKKKEAMRMKRIETLGKMEGGDALIKTEVAILFEKSQHNEALTLVDDLRKAGHTVNVSSDVNAQSLKAFVRENMRSGNTVDQESLGLYIGHTAKITKPEAQ